MQSAWLLEQNPRPDRRRGPRGDQRQPVPLHRLREHRQGGPAGGGRAAGPTAPAWPPRPPRVLARPEEAHDDDRELQPPRPPKSGAWATRSSARRTRASSRARASTSRTSTCRASCGSTSSGRPTPTRGSSRSTPSEALKIPGVAAVVTGKDLEGYKLHWMPTLAGDMQMVLPVDTVMYQSQEVAAVIATSRYAAADGVAAVEVDYEPLPVVVDPYKALEPDAPVLRPGPGRGQADQPHLALGVGRRGGRRRRARERRGPGRRGHLHPADPRRLDRDLRLRRRLGPDPPAADAAHDQPGAARDPHRGRARRRRRRASRSTSTTSGSRPTTSAAGSAARCRSTRATCSRSRPRS